MKTVRWLAIVVIALFSGFVLVGDASADATLARSVEQLRSAVGRWSVVTEFLNEDGSVAKAVTGSYEFEWVVPDRLLIGRSNIPELKQSSGILFYVNEKKRIIEMASVGADGDLWVMTGAAGEETRYSQKYKSNDGKDGQLRFTRYNVSPAQFESRMEPKMVERPGRLETTRCSAV